VGAAILAVLALMIARPLEANAEDLRTWRHGLLDPKSDAGFSHMITQGFAEKQGLKLEVFHFQADTQLLQALIAGQLDSFEGSPGNDIMAASHGADVRIIGCTWPGLPHVILSREIRDPKDLKGKNVAVGPTGSLPDLLFRIFLKQANISPSEVHVTSVGNDTDRYKALVGHVVDAAVVSNEFVPIIKKDNLRLLASAREFAPKFPRLCIQTTGTLLKTRGDDVTHFMAAEIASMRYAASHREETLSLTRKLTKQKESDPRAGYIFDWAVKSQSVDPEVQIPVEKLDYVEKQLQVTGNLKSPYDVKRMLDPSVREKALKLLQQ